jgi:hypothetical protein
MNTNEAAPSTPGDYRTAVAVGDQHGPVLTSLNGSLHGLGIGRERPPVEPGNMDGGATRFERFPEWLHVLRLVVQTVHEDHFGRRHTLSQPAIGPVSKALA